MSDEDALLAAIRAHPDEDTPRLIYADWLQENGRAERAEFIRLQCLPDADESHLMREADLEERNRGRWLVELGVPQFADTRWEFRRGFPEHLVTTVDALLKRYSAFTRVVWSRSICLDDLNGSMLRDFLSREWPPQWVELELRDRSVPHLGIWADETDSFAVLIAGSSRMRQLHRLRLSFDDLTAVGVEALRNSPHLDQLECFRLEGCRDDSQLELLRDRFGDRLVIWS